MKARNNAVEREQFFQRERVNTLHYCCQIVENVSYAAVSEKVRLIVYAVFERVFRFSYQ